MLLSTSIPNMINGISQQPDVMRLSSQGQEQINGLSSVVDGLQKRPGTTNIAKLIDGQIGNAYIDLINRDLSERYIVAVSDGDIKVFDVDGNTKTVNYPDGTTYLASSDPKHDFTTVTIADYTFIVNRNTTIAMDAELSPDRGKEAIVFVKAVNYLSDYKITIDGECRAFVQIGDGNRGTPPDDFAVPVKTTETAEDLKKHLEICLGTGNPQADSQWEKETDYVLGDKIWPTYDYEADPPSGGPGDFYYEVTTAGKSGSTEPTWVTTSGNTNTDGTVTWTCRAKGAMGGWNLTVFQSTIHITKTDKSDFEIKVEDSRANTGLKVAKDTVQQFSDLPTTAPTDFTVEVVGDKSSNFDNYYVRFVPKNESADYDEGTWAETVKPGIPWKIDGGTMPHALIRDSDGTFSFEKLVWGAREVGDEDSAPDPTFIGRTIADIFFDDNRLGMLSDENGVMSRKAYFFDYFPSTVTTLVKSDPVDLAASHSKVSLLKHAVPWDKQTIFFSDQTQFVMEKDGGITPDSSIDVLTNFEAAPNVSPVASGKNIFFCVNRGGFTGVREYYIEPDTQTKDAADISAHVPKYIPNGVFKLAAATTEDVMVVLSASQQSRLYIYKYYWSSNEKLQSSWSYWDFPSGTLLNVGFIESYLYLMIQRSDGVYLERMCLAPGTIDEGEPIEYLLGRKITQAECSSVTYDSASNTTTFTLPYQIESDMQVVTTGTNRGRVLQIREAVTGTNTIQVLEDHTSSEVIIGEKYTFEYTFSERNLKEDSTQGSAAIKEGRVQIEHLTIVFNDTGYFRVEVTPKYRETSTHVFNGKILNSGENVLGEIPIESGDFRVPIKSKNDQVVVKLVNDSPFPSNFISFEAEIKFNIRSKRF